MLAALLDPENMKPIWTIQNIEITWLLEQPIIVCLMTPLVLLFYGAVAKLQLKTEGNIFR